MLFATVLSNYFDAHLEVTMQNIGYYSPRTIGQVFSCFEKTAGTGRIIAGGTDLMIFYANAPQLRKDLIDISAIHEMLTIAEEDGYIVIGAAVTHSRVAQSALIKEYAPLLAHACGEVGSKQIRNVATVGGNIVTALPAADSAVTLTALDAECEVYTDANSSSWIPILELYKGVGSSHVATNHLLTRIRFTADKNRKSAYQRMSIRKALSLPMLNVGAALTINNNVIEKARVVIAPAGNAPLRASCVEKALEGKAPSEALFKEVSCQCLEGCAMRSSAVRGSKEYREKVMPVFVYRALCEAVK